MEKFKVKKSMKMTLSVLILLTVGLGMLITVQAEERIISSGDYSIIENGEYQLNEDYSGIITIASNVDTVTVIGSVYGTVHSNTSIVIEGGIGRSEAIQLTIENLNITSSSSHFRPGIDFSSATEGTNKLFVSGVCSVKGLENNAGIHIPDGVELIIDKAADLTDDDQAVLTATGDYGAAGIGGRGNSAGGIITINGGTITAIGGGEAAGIGGGKNGAGGTITINGGILTATGGVWGAGIGGGFNGEGGTIIINNGMITATGGSSSAGIGIGYNGSGGSITINEGSVMATGGRWAPGIGGGFNNKIGSTITINSGTVISNGGEQAAGIGGSSGGNGGTITINGGRITATAGEAMHSGAGIGGGMYGSGGVIEINDGIVIASGGSQGAGIGGGSWEGSGGSITINGGTITATGFAGGAGIGGGFRGEGGTIIINEGSIEASGGYSGAGIGGGGVGSGGSITINSGIVTAKSFSLAAGIGGGESASGGTILIKGGTVTATAGNFGAGIGNGGFAGTSGDITISGGTVIANGGFSGAGIGGGYLSDGGIITIKDEAIVTAIGGGGSAGIGGGVNGSGGVISITESNVTATGGDNGYDTSGGGAGIGGGSNGVGGTITINGSTVTATGGFFGAGIGGGYNGDGGTITIKEGIVTATGGYYGAGIGGGYNGSGGNVTILGTPLLIARANTESNAEHIGKGENGSDSGTLKLTDGSNNVDLCYLQFSTPGVSAAKIEIEGINGEFQTNDQGLWAIIIPRFENIKYTVSKDRYKTVKGSLVLSSTSHGIDVAMLPVKSESSPATKPKEIAEIIIEKDKFPIEVVIDKKSGNARVSPDEKRLEEIFEKAKVNERGKKTILLKIPEIEAVSSYTIEVSVTRLSSEGTEREILLDTPLGTVCIPDNMLTGLENMTGKKATITIGLGDKTKIPSDLKALIDSRPIVQFTLEIDGKKVIWKNLSAPITVSIPYKPTEEELGDPEHIVIWYIDRESNVLSIPSGRYDHDTGTVKFNTTHFSQYAVVFVQKTFNDLDQVAWAKKQIEVLGSKGIVRGVSEEKYEPKADVTRADFLYFLVRTLCVDAKIDGNFEDIRSDSYYYKEIAIAKKLGITSGTGNNRFNPDKSITRQDMMVLTEKALSILKKLKQQGTALDLDGFSDRSYIAAYALDSVASMVKEGLIVGSGDQINPLGYTTRAEAAVFLYKIYNKY